MICYDVTMISQPANMRHVFGIESLTKAISVLAESLSARQHASPTISYCFATLEVLFECAYDYTATVREQRAGEGV